ncbi:hypothetical protein FBZ91_107185 [Nitrospirillum viridazoti]|uniref:Uncharacterized protein n=1 Tax=Nitrospirillum viridazoti CBAmc TaxID=1441467 RepID=A0A248JQ19_9PROT|nr:hypothetical protein Y958_08220 [Nitrospirillum amazonense CBAmc]TWB37872.1 hypothetical protein FBZ91_107185 [Nitrospirillum amazonense]
MSFGRQDYRRANQDLLRALGALGTCDPREMSMNDMLSHVMEMDDVEIAGDYETAARSRMAILGYYFQICMDLYLVRDVNKSD